MGFHSSMISFVNLRAPNDATSDFIPIDSLSRPDADTMLVFLSGNGVGFLKPTTDPWYRATVKLGTASRALENETTETYRPEEATSPLGCIQQFQFCNPSLPQETRCGPLASRDDAFLGSAALFNLNAESSKFPSDPTGSRFGWFIAQLSNTVVTVPVILSSLGATALESQKYQSSGMMGEIPENQWQKDISQVFSIYLASLQAGNVNAALGPSDPALEPYKITPPNEYVWELCKSQVRAQGHLNILDFSNHQAELISLLNSRKSSAQHIFLLAFLDFTSLTSWAWF